MRHAFLSVLGAAALGLVALTADALTASPAQAQFSIVIGGDRPYGYDSYRPYPRRHWEHRRRHYDPGYYRPIRDGWRWEHRRRHYDPGYYRPIRGGYGIQCINRQVPYFDGFRWRVRRECVQSR